MKLIIRLISSTAICPTLNNIGIARVAMERDLCARKKVAFDEVVLTCGSCVICNDAKATIKQPNKLCHQ